MMAKINLLDTRFEANRIIYRINKEYLNYLKNFINKVILKDECNNDNKTGKTKD